MKPSPPKAPAQEKPAPEKPKPPPKEPPKADPKPPPPPPPPPQGYHDYHDYHDYQAHVHHYQLVHQDKQRPAYHHYFEHQYSEQPTFVEPMGAYRQMTDEQQEVGSIYGGYQPPAIDYAQPPTACPQNVVVGCAPVVTAVPCSGGYEPQPYAAPYEPTVYAPNPENRFPETQFYREDLPETHDVGTIAEFIPHPQTHHSFDTQIAEPHAEPKIPTKLSATTSVDKSIHSPTANLIDSDAKAVIIHADTTSTTENLSEIKPIPAFNRTKLIPTPLESKPIPAPIDTKPVPVSIDTKSVAVPTGVKPTKTAKQMEVMRKMAKQMNELHKTKTQKTAQAPPVQAQPPQTLPPQTHSSPALSAQTMPEHSQPDPTQLSQMHAAFMPHPLQMLDAPQMMPESHLHMVGAPQMIGSSSAGGSPMQSMYYQNYQYTQ